MKCSVQHKMVFGWAAALLVLLASGCSKDPHTGRDKDTPGTKLFTLEVEIPGPAELQSKAMTADDERKVGELDLLLFYDNNGTEVFDRRFTFDAAQIDNSGWLYKFDVALPTSTDRSYRLVLLANARTQVAAAGAALVAGNPRETVMDALGTFAVGASGWDVTTPALIPMWAETENLMTITPNTVFTSFQLVRALARFDIELSEAAQEKLELISVAFYNYAKEGHVAPADNNYSHLSEKALTPTVPATAFQGGLLEYSFPNTIEIEAEIYAAEFKNVGTPTAKKSHLLIKATDKDLGQVKWYKIDLIDSRTGEELDILRNFLYKITIKSVTGAGSDTPEGTFQDDSGSPLNADVIPWRKGYEEDQGITGRYYLDIPNTNLNYTADGTTRTGIRIEINTNYPGGWHVSKVLDINGDPIPESERWVNIIKGEAYYHNGSEYGMWESPMLIREPNLTQESRYARFFITAGPLEYVIHITQHYLASCGEDGQYGYLTVGGRSYKTHRFVDNYVRSVNCWMVENLAYDPGGMDDYIIKKYDDHINEWNDPELKPEEGERGYYYSLYAITQYSIRPCPDGWEVPSDTQVSYLFYALHGYEDYQYSFPASLLDDGPAYKRAFIENPKDNPLFAGFINNNGSSYFTGTWLGWGDGTVGISPIGYATLWFAHTVSYNDPLMGSEIIYFNNFSNGTSMMWGRSMTSIHSYGNQSTVFLPVRCVKNKYNKEIN